MELRTFFVAFVRKSLKWNVIEQVASSLMPLLPWSRNATSFMQRRVRGASLHQVTLQWPWTGSTTKWLAAKIILGVPSNKFSFFFYCYYYCLVLFCFADWNLTWCCDATASRNWSTRCAVCVMRYKYNDRLIRYLEAKSGLSCKNAEMQNTENFLRKPKWSCLRTWFSLLEMSHPKVNEIKLYQSSQHRLLLA